MVRMFSECEIDFDVTCVLCGEKLIAKQQVNDQNETDPILVVTPCHDCHDDVQEAAYKKGLADGRNDGFFKGVKSVKGGWLSWPERLSYKQEVGGSSPPPLTTFDSERSLR